MRNAADGISFAQTAEGALKEMGDILLHARDLVVQAGNGSYNDKDLESLSNDFYSAIYEVVRIRDSTEFNGEKVFDSTTSGSKTDSFYVGYNAGDNNIIDITIDNIGLNPSGAFSDFIGFGERDLGFSSISHNTRFNNTFTLIESNLNRINSNRAKLGAAMNRFESIISGLNHSYTIAETSRSRITDTDFAAESAKLNRNQILQQAATAMLAQANQTPNQVLSLLSR